MIVSLTQITPLVRYLVVDYARLLNPGDIYTFIGSYVFTTSQPYVTSIDSVYINGVSIGLYSVDSTFTKITINTPLNQGDTIEIRYNYYPNYSDDELFAQVQAAIIYLSVNNYYTFEIDSNDNIYPDITAREQNLIAFVASILVKPDNINIRLPDMNITTATNIPTRDIISKAVRIFKHSSTGVFDVAGFGSAFPTTYYYYFR